MKKKKKEIFICNEQKIEIPEEFKTIVIRSNFGKSGPHPNIEEQARTIWPDSGSVLSRGSRGLFGVLLSQDLHYLEMISLIHPNPQFIILEVDKRALSTVGLVFGAEVEFRACNVLFNGDIDVFFERIKEYTTEQQNNKLNYCLDWKLREIQESRKAPLLAQKNTLLCLLRIDDALKSNSPILRMGQILLDLKSRN